MPEALYASAQKQRMATRSRIRVLVLGVSLLLVLWGLYLSHIDAFPPFIDETVHIDTGERILETGRPLEGVNLGRQIGRAHV